MRKTKASSAKHKRGSSGHGEAVKAPMVIPSRRSEPRSHQELAQAIFAECDPVRIGRELLSSGSEKGASVRARFFETLVEWQFGKPSGSSADRVRIVWDLPCPPHERLDQD